MTRPEALPVLAGIFGVAVGERFWNDKSDRKPWSWSCVVPLACGLVQPLLNLWLTGSPAANGMRAKSWLYNHPFDPVDTILKASKTFLSLLRTLALGIKWDHQLGAISGPPAWGKPGQVVLYLPPLFGLAGLAYLAWRTLREWRERRVGAASALLATVMVALAANATMMTAEWHYYRYVIPFLSIVLIAGAVTIVRIAHAIRGGWYRKMYMLLTGALFVVSCASVPDFGAIGKR